jgi:chromosome segregation ATPase
MKRLAPLALLSLFSLMAAPLMAAEEAPGLTGCAAKRQAISTQIEQAKAHGNSEQQAGLEKALSEVTSHCTDASLKKERENKVLDAKHEVSRRQADLEKAMKKGDSEKINKRKDKLAESRKELQQALDDLDK